MKKTIGLWTLSILVAACGGGGEAGDEDTGSVTDSESDGDSDSDSNSDSESGSDSDSESDGDSDSDSDSDSSSDSDSVSESDSGSEPDTDTQCFDQVDFTPCGVVTTPDRSYDICIRGSCRSPGCGTAVCNAPGPHFLIPDTNQRVCYDDGTTGEISCPAAGEGFHGQDAQYGWDTTHAAAERFTRDTATANEPLVIDNVTTLMWQGCAAGLGGDACNAGTVETYNWGDALTYCDALSWGGFGDWHLPDLYELDAILDAGRHAPAIDTSAYLATPSYWFWSLSSYVNDEGYAWAVSFETGSGEIDPKYNYFHVRCVRGGPGGAERFTRDTSTANEPLVTDNVTTLMWQGCSSGRTGDACATGNGLAGPWEGALAYCEGLAWGGHDDWRLPNRHELYSITENSRIDPAIDSSVFPATPSDWFWSSSSQADSVDSAWLVTFGTGTVYYGNKTLGAGARCVRGGPLP